jgi:hypothetical protein
MLNLDYAASIPWYRRPKFRRALLVLFILGALSVWIYLAYPSIERRCRLMYWQSQCMKHVTPAGTLVFEPVTYPNVRSLPTPNELDTFSRLLNPAYMPPGPVMLSGGDDQFLFMHKLECKAGEFLVVIHYSLAYYSTAQLKAKIYTPGTWFGDPAVKEVNIDATLPPKADGGWLYDVKIYAGVPDTKDLGALTVNYEQGGVHGMIRLKLSDGGDALRLVP